MLRWHIVHRNRLSRRQQHRLWIQVLHVCGLAAADATAALGATVAAAQPAAAFAATHAGNATLDAPTAHAAASIPTTATPVRVDL